MSKTELNDIPKHRRYKQSDKSKSSKKSNHKHIYEEVLLRYFNKYSLSVDYMFGKRCTICGRIKIGNLFITKCENGQAFRTILHCGDILKDYPDLPIVDYEY